MRFSLKIFCTQNIAERIVCNGYNLPIYKLLSTNKVGGLFISKEEHSQSYVLLYGGDGRARTYDLMHVKHAL